MIGLSTENVNLFIESNGRVLKSTNWSDSLCCDRTTPLETIKIKDEEIIEPKLAITTSKDVHLVVNYARGVELSHRSFSSDNTWNIEAQLVHSLLQIYENDIGQYLKAIPSTVYNYLTAIPDLA